MFPDVNPHTRTQNEDPRNELHDKKLSMSAAPLAAGSALGGKSAEIEPSSLSTFLRLQSPMPNGSGSVSGSDREPGSLAGFLTAAAAHVESSPKQGPKP